MNKKPTVEDIFKKYGKKLSEEVEESGEIDVSGMSKEYEQFKKDMAPELTRYERLCRTLGSVIKIKVSEKDRARIQKKLDVAHLDITPAQVLTLAIVSMFAVFFLGILASVAIYIISGEFPLMLLFLVLLASMFLFYYFYSKPTILANKWRLKASSQMVPCILYIVAYMKHTSNLERAVAFASQHLAPPLSLDLRKVFWDMETGKYSNIKQSLDAYLETWRDTNVEFIESFHLIESSLFEPSDDRRVLVLERALQVILDGVYEKMLRYSRDVRSPLTNIFMLGILLPTLAITLIPLASALVGQYLRWYHVLIIFNIIIPFAVYYMTSRILLTRPGGYGEAELLEMSPLYPKYKSKRPYWIALLIALPFLILGLLPFIFQTGLAEAVGLQRDYSFSQIGIELLGDMKIFDFISTGTNGGVVGPFGIVAVILSLLVPFSVALFFFVAYNMKTREIIKTRQDSKKLEREFANSLFQLGNRLGDGIPAEIAFAHVAESSKGTTTEGFFKTVNTNIQQLGMGLEQAIFNKRRGAIIFYPSALISTSMKILIQSVKKGLKVAARSLMSISDYIKNINKINERMRDLLAEVVSEMKSNMAFLAPLMAGVVVGLGNMITVILSRLFVMFESEEIAEVAGMNLETFFKIFQITEMIPPYFLQLAIGFYIVEIIFILSSTLVTVDAGEDKLRKAYEIGKNLRRGTILYIIVALVSIIALTLLAAVSLGGLT